jgi:hypothetical protein
MPLYFAYGSNMDAVAMAARCPASKPLGPARLARHRFVITREGYASVRRDPRRDVWGIAWDLALADMPALDRFENVAGRLYVKAAQSVLTQAGPRRALVYIASSAETGLPRLGYLEGILEAAGAAGLPAGYIAEIAAWSSGVRPAPAAPAPVEPKVRALWASPRSPRDGPKSY